MKKKTKKTVIDQVKGHTKVIAGIISAYGVTQIMGSAMRDFSPDVKGVKKLVIKLGAAAMTGMMIKMVEDLVDFAIEVVSDHFDHHAGHSGMMIKMVEDLVDFAEEAMKKVNKKDISENEKEVTDNV